MGKKYMLRYSCISLITLSDMSHTPRIRSLSALALVALLTNICSVSLVSSVTAAGLSLADIVVREISDGTTPLDTQTYVVDSPTAVNAGDDSSQTNRIVRSADVVEYSVSSNLNTSDTANYTTMLTLDRGTFVSLPSVCLTDTSTVTVPVANRSTISPDGRILTCNHGMMTKGKATLYTVFVKADVTLNNTKLNMVAVVRSDDLAPISGINPVQVTITSRPAVDLQQYVDSVDATPAGPGHSAIFTPAYEKYVCYNGSSIVANDYDSTMNA
jgi:hypothetical protein